MATPAPLYLTTPIYYVNDRPHIGHAYTTILADVMARYHRLSGGEARLQTGTDEHGQKVQEAADRRGVSPQAHCDELHHAFRDLLPALHIQADHFIRTTDPAHATVVQAGLQDLFDRGEIYTRDYTGWYSTAAERFWTEKDLENGRCPDTGQAVELITERNYFFRMSKYSDTLRAHIETNPDFIQPPHRANEILGFLNKGLEDLCISRPKARLSWGIPLPFDDAYVTYVWFDALLNYISGLGVGGDAGLYDHWWPHTTHIIGKDILTTHCVYWTTMLLAFGRPLPRHIIAHGWWLMGDTKMSKSLGNVVDPLALKDIYGPESLRYALMRDMVIGLDANFSEAGLVRRINSDLANDLGNLVRRTGGLISKWFDGNVPEPGDAGDAERTVAASFEALRMEVPELVTGLKVHSAIEAVLQRVRALNKYISDTAPFKTVKTDPQAAALNLYTVLEGLRHAAWLLWPVMPEKMDELLRRIGAPREGALLLSGLKWGDLAVGVAMGAGPPLFPRAEAPAVVAVEPAPKTAPKKAKAKKAAKPKAALAPGTIDFDTFQSVELRAGVVRTAERVSGSDRLLALEVDLGEPELRPIVSGIAAHFTPEALVGARVTIVANLAPRTIFKQVSQGMLLTTENADGALILVGPVADVPPGTRLA